MDGLVLGSVEAHFGNELNARNLLVARVKITSYNHPATAGSAPFFRALVVSATKFTREKEPTTSSNQPETKHPFSGLGTRRNQNQGC